MKELLDVVTEIKKKGNIRDADAFKIAVEFLKLQTQIKALATQELLLDAVIYGLQTHDRRQPPYLEAIAMILGYNGEKIVERGTILDELREKIR